MVRAGEPREEAMYVKSLTLQDVKGFESLHFDFDRPDGSFSGWTVFVGGNASGKSTVLKTMPYP